MIQPTTELDAVNVMMDYLGEAPVNSYDEAEGTEAMRALSLLREASRAIQSEGCSFNTELQTFRPDTEGRVNIPANVLHLKPLDNRYILRGSLLYDRRESTFVITEEVRALTVYALAFDELPEPVRYYLAVTSARKLVSRAIGSGEMLNQVMIDEGDAKRRFLEYEREQDRPTLYSAFERAQIAREVSCHDRGKLCL